MPAASGALGPWPSVAAAAAFLTALADGRAPAAPAGTDGAALADWLIYHDLGPLTAHCLRDGRDPALAERLAGDAFAAVAENSLLFRVLGDVLAGLGDAGIPVLALKGVALAATVYADPAHRPMSDVDLWVPPDRMPAAAAVLRELGFAAHTRPDRPPAWQALVGGELQFVRPGWARGLVELHGSPFEGDWLRWAAAVRPEAAWARRRPLELAGHAVARLAPEDAIIHLALHLATGPKFGRSAARTLVDLGRLCRQEPPDWSALAAEARAWRVWSAVSAVLWLARTLVGLPGLPGGLLPAPRPGIGHLVSPVSVLSGRDWRRDPRGYLLLLLLVDRPRDAARLLARTLWPDRAWREARRY